ERISRDGWAQQGQMMDEETLELSYTIGNYERGWPELMMVGPPVIRAMLDALCELMRKNNRPFADGEIIETEYNFPLKALNVNDGVKKHWTPVVGDYYRTNDYALQEIVMGDASGVSAKERNSLFGFSVGDSGHRNWSTHTHRP